MCDRDHATVFIVDDDAAMRNLIRRFVESTGLPCESFASAVEFLDGLDATRAGCLVVDYEMPEMSGLQLQETLARRGVSLPVIMVTGHGTIPIAVRAVQAMAVDVLEKPFRGEHLLRRIAEALRINQQRRQQERQQTLLAARFAGLTKREREVMSLVVQGLANKQIARRLHLSDKTVEAHRGHMMKKVGVASVADLVQLAMAVREDSCASAPMGDGSSHPAGFIPSFMSRGRDAPATR